MSSVGDIVHRIIAGSVLVCAWFLLIVGAVHMYPPTHAERNPQPHHLILRGTCRGVYTYNDAFADALVTHEDYYPVPFLFVCRSVTT